MTNTPDRAISLPNGRIAPACGGSRTTRAGGPSTARVTSEWGSMSKLSDFGGGRVDIRDQLAKPEKKVCFDLSQWFVSNGASVFWDEDPGGLLHKTEFDTFTKTGVLPDLLVIGDDRTFAIEVKNANDTASVHDGVTQTHKYWKEYTLNDATYTAGGHEVDIDAFLLGTQFSIEGSLYARYFDKAVREWSASERFDWFDGEVYFTPDWEFSASESVTRLLWRLAKRDALDASVTDNDHAGIGAVFSTYLDGSKPTRPDYDADGYPPREVRSSFEPRACYKRPVANAGGHTCHNWRWVE